MPADQKTWTAADLPGLPGQGRAYELTRGELVAVSPASHRHGRYGSVICSLLEGFAYPRGLGEAYTEATGFALTTDPDTVWCPDVGFVASETIERVDPPDEGFFPGPPDLAVEVVSPSDRRSDVEAKACDWIGFGCRMVWVAWPTTRTIDVTVDGRDKITLHEDDLLRGEPVLPGFEIRAGDVFDRAGRRV